MERSLIKELMQTHEKICKSLITGIVVLFAICLLNMTHFPKDVLLVCGIYTLVRLYQSRNDTPVLQVCDSALAFIIYAGAKKCMGMQLGDCVTVYNTCLLALPVMFTPVILSIILSAVYLIRDTLEDIKCSLEAARITSCLPFKKEELDKLGINDRYDYIKALHNAVQAVDEGDEVSAEFIADTVCNTRGQEICDILNHFDTNHEKKDIFLLYADKDFVDKCLDTVGIKDVNSRHYTAYFVLKGCCGDKLSVNDIKKLVKAFIIWR